MVNVIFLDIDGVMRTSHSDEWWSNFLGEHIPLRVTERRLSRTAISNLNYLVTYSTAKIVISSTWRLNLTLEQLQNHFKKCGFSGEVIDTTPIIGSRGEEIQFYLDTHPVNKYVVIDDTVTDILNHISSKRVVKCDPQIGLEDDSLVDRALDLIA
jgi:hypothetical protein